MEPGPSGAEASRVAEQIEADLEAAAHPLTSLLGDDLCDLVAERIRSRAPLLAAQLTGDDDRLAARTVTDMMCALSDPPPDWWRTPLGRVVAASLGSDDAEAVRPSVAQAMLGISRARLYQLLDGGKLDRHPDGGIVRSSVMQRLASAPT